MQNILKGVSTVALFTLISRIFGFIRDLLVARLFGSSVYADAYFVAFKIPNLLRSIFAEGALTSAFIPVFSEEFKKGTNEAQKAFSSIFSILIIVTSIISIFGIYFASDLINAFAPGFKSSSDKWEISIVLTRIMMPYIIFVSIVALINGVLNTGNIFGSSAIAQVLMNLTLILGALLANFGTSEYIQTLILSGSVLVGGLVQIIAQFNALRKIKIKILLTKRIFTNATKRVFLLFIPAILGSTVYQITIFISTVLASYLQNGSISWLFYADRITQLPLGIFTIALSSVLLPSLSNAQANNQTNIFHLNLKNSIRYTNFIIIPLSLFLFFYSTSIVQVLFQRGDFNQKSTLMTSIAVTAQAFGLWSSGVYSMIVRAFFAQKNTKIPTLIGLFNLASTFLLSILFMGKVSPLNNTEPNKMISIISYVQNISPYSFDFKHAGLVLSSTVSSVISLLLIVTIFVFRERNFDLRNFLYTFFQSVFSGILSVYCLTFLNLNNFYLNQEAFKLSINIISFSILYLFFQFLFNSLELKETIRLFNRIANTYVISKIFKK